MEIVAGTHRRLPKEIGVSEGENSPYRDVVRITELFVGIDDCSFRFSPLPSADRGLFYGTDDASFV
jgi:hypothetical protein